MTNLRPSLLQSLVLTAAFATIGCDGDKDKPKSVPKPPPIVDQPGGAGAGLDGNPALGANINPEQLLARVKPILQPLPDAAPNPDNPTSDAKVSLGRMLYFDARLSKNHDVSCNTCHDLASYGVDTRMQNGKLNATSLGHKGQPGDRNSPTVYNAALHFVQFWDGRAKDVEEQAKGPVLNPVEMAMADEASVVAVLKSIPGYAEPFAAAFGEGEAITYDNMAKAIGVFERELLTPAKFDKFAAGDADALNGTELAGLELFLDVGCTQCHAGSLIGGAQFQKLGSIKPWPGLEDEGRKQVTQNEADKFVFKVPSLRNITKTGPYLHDGSEADLGKVVQMMSEHQTARGKLEAEEVEAMLAFFATLEGELPTDKIAQPELPPNGPKTPAPDPA